MIRDLLETLTLIAGIWFSGEDGKCPPQATCLALVVFGESRSESIHGQLAVADVVLSSGRDVCATITEPYRFEALDNWPYPRRPEKINPYAWGVALGVAHAALNGAKSKCHGATNFYAHDVMTPYWAVGRSRCIIGGHTFVWLPDRCKKQLEC